MYFKALIYILLSVLQTAGLLCGSHQKAHKEKRVCVKRSLGGIRMLTQSGGDWKTFDISDGGGVDRIVALI